MIDQLIKAQNPDYKPEPKLPDPPKSDWQKFNEGTGMWITGIIMAIICFLILIIAQHYMYFS